MGNTFDIGSGVGALIGAFGIGAGAQDRRAYNQQKKLQELQVKGAKELSEFQKGQDLEMWKNTSYPAQMEMMKQAGLNPSLMYGQGGGGGTTTGSGGGGMPSGGSATDGANSASARMGMGMQIAQMAMMKAQTEKTQAEADNLRGNTGKTGEETKLLAWENAVKTAMGENGKNLEATAREKEAELRDLSATTDYAKLQAYMAGAIGEKENTDPNSPLAKAIRAGLDQTTQTLENSKKTGDVLEAQKAIEGFKANLAKQGISPDSPWYVKILTTLLSEKLGINLTGVAGTAVKNVINK